MSPPSAHLSSNLAWLRALRQPEVTLTWTLAEWERVIRLARRLRLLARLSHAVSKGELLAHVPERPRRHLVAEARLSTWRSTSMTWALERIADTLGGGGYPMVLLKGAAYMGQDLPNAAGRLPSDVDIMVPKAALPHALARLQAAGWAPVTLDAHDQRYYAEWSHEAPPMTHAQHGLELDLHHNILPPVASTRVDADLLLQRLGPSRWPGWQVLQPLDQVLHCAAHLFHDSELRDRLRDLVDLDAMLRHFGRAPDFWPQLAARGDELGLSESLALACHFCVRWLGTPMPDVDQARISGAGPSRWRKLWLLPTLSRVLVPTEPDDRPSIIQDAAATLLLARYHRNRMPILLLVPHLWHKLRVQPGTVEAPRAP